MKKYQFVTGVAFAALVWNAPVMAQSSQAERAYNECLGTLIEGHPDQGTVTCAPPPIPPRILVSASRDADVFIFDYTGAATIIDQDQIEQRQARDIGEILRDVPGVAVSAVAGQTQVRLRGSEANHVLVLVDGIEVSDPFSGEFDLGTLQLEPGARVEVLRGPQSALYGADAIGGLIAYQTARGDELRGLSARIEGGSNDTINGSARFGLGDYDANIAIAATVVSTDGEPNARGGVRDIGRDSYTVSGKGFVRPTESLELRSVGRFIRTEGDFNDQDFSPISPTFGFVIDSPQTRFENEAIYALIGASLNTLGDAWRHDVSIQMADITRDTFNGFGRSSGSEGDRLKASYVSAATLETGAIVHHLTGAIDWERERFRNNDPFGFAFAGRREIENVGLAGEYRLEGSRLDLSAAIRHDINDRFADETTFRVGASYNLSDYTRLRGSVGSGIKNPGFFELFGFFDGRFIGNEDLKPEKSTGWEIGIDQSFANGSSRLALTYFESTLEDEIFTTFPPPTFLATPANRTTDSKRKGVELSAAARLGGGFSIDAAYTYLDAEEDGVEEVRRPDNIASAAINWTHPRDNVSATLVIRHNGAAEDLAFTDPSFIPVRVTLDDYTLVSFNARVRIADGIETFGRIENLLDETYEQVFSFFSPGRTAVIGLSASF